ncbi:MAG: hypothetical protein Q4D61_01865 [Cardiobacteriaceae bacterium]|nr:hypothetical protein [Cardiobacteriaceae bacterium]
MRKTLALTCITLALTACSGAPHTAAPTPGSYTMNDAELKQFDRGVQHFENGRYQEALAIFLPLAEKGERDALYNAGVTYRRLNNDGAAIPLLQRAAQLGDKDAHCTLGNIQDNINSYKSARRHYEQAAAAGLPCGQNALADYYLNGLDVKRDFRKSFALAQQSANQNDAHGQYLLALHYLNSWAVPHNPAEARRWLEKAAAQGHKRAREQLSQ